MKNDDKVTIKIPRPLYERIKEVIKKSGFDSATDFIVYCLRDLLADKAVEDKACILTKKEVDMVRRRLKSLGYLSISLFLSLFLNFGTETAFAQNQKKQLRGTITISGAWALYPMTIKWADEFKKIYPDVKFDISAGGAGKGMTDALSDIVDIGLVSRDINSQEIDKGAFSLAVTKDAVVATMNINNPSFKNIIKNGLKRSDFINIWLSEDNKNWLVFTRSDACGAAETWAKYLGAKQEDLKGIGVYGDPGVAEAVRKNIKSIGYNNVGFAYEPKTKKPINDLAVIPIDINENGVIDDKEDFYKDRDSLTAAIAGGIYPSPPARNLYFVTLGKPKKEIVIEFVKWVLTDGQNFAPQAGYVNISKKELESELKKIQ